MSVVGEEWSERTLFIFGLLINTHRHLYYCDTAPGLTRKRVIYQKAVNLGHLATLTEQ